MLLLWPFGVFLGNSRKTNWKHKIPRTTKGHIYKCAKNTSQEHVSNNDINKSRDKKTEDESNDSEFKAANTSLTDPIPQTHSETPPRLEPRGGLEPLDGDVLQEFESLLVRPVVGEHVRAVVISGDLFDL